MGTLSAIFIPHRSTLFNWSFSICTDAWLLTSTESISYSNAVLHQSQLRTKLAQLSDFVETDLFQAAHKQKTAAYDQHTQQQHLKIGRSI